jgi:hypothetical protein
MPTNPDDKARVIQRKYYGDPQGLAQHLVSICLSEIEVVNQVFFILDNFSTLDVGYRFVSLMPQATLLNLVKTKKGLGFCKTLLYWLLYVDKGNTNQAVAPNVDLVPQLMRLKQAIDNAPPPNEKEESPYYTIDAGIVLETDALAVLDKIGSLYFAKVGKKFNVNSGTRNAYRQADAMYTVYMSGDKTLHLYTNRKVANELIAIIKKGESKEVTIQKMGDLIQKYFEQGTLMSGHQKAGAIDIDVNGDNATGVSIMSPAEQKIMMAIAKSVTGFDALLERHPVHIHIKFK